MSRITFRLRPPGFVFAGSVLLLICIACSSNPNRGPTPSTVPVVRPNPAAPDPEPVPSEPSEDPVVQEAREDDSVVVIDPGGQKAASGTRLSDLAAAERNRRQLADAPVLVITDDNLAEHAAGGKLTFADRPAGEPAQVDFTQQAKDRDAQETYWRQRIRQKREEWAQKVTEIFTLEERANTLRNQFYAADDPFYRDARIKPEWDRTLDNLSTARKDARALELEVERIVGEGRRAGAQPGWLRDGVELEPTERPYDDEGHAPEPPHSVEPDVAGDPP